MLFFQSRVGLLFRVCRSASRAVKFSFQFPKLFSKMKFQYPSFHQSPTIDDYHGHKVPDPYRWLEDPNSDETKAFIEAQNNLTFPYLKSCPDREKVHRRLTELWNYPKYECPVKAGKYYYFRMNSGLQNQSVLYKLKHLDGEPEIFIDPNEFSKEGLISMSNFEFSQDGQFMAYAISEKGSDWNKIKIKNAFTLEDMPDLIENVKYSSIAWTHDNKGFFYSRCPNENKDDGTETTEHKFSKLYYHKINTDQSDDIMCVEFPDQPTWIPIGYVSSCGKYMFASVQETCKNEMLYYCDLEKLKDITGPLPLIPLIDKFEAEYNYVTNDGSLFIFHTDKNAPLYRVVAINLEDPSEENWIDVIPEDQKNVMAWAVCVHGDKLLISHIEDVKSTLGLYDLKSGNRIQSYPLDLGHIRGVFGRKKESEIFFNFQSFLTPGIIYYCNLQENNQPKIFRETVVPDFDTSEFDTEQVFYSSKDGTRVPMFIVKQKDFVKDGTAPAFLYGYGGFNMNIMPMFTLFRLTFVKHFGGILAYPNIRGGGEYGEGWHESGCKFKKQNVFDDFIAAAEYLIATDYTTEKKLIINGGSNGGLLVGACLNQRPELFGCAIAQVGVMDMLRYHKFTIGHAWKSDYCCADDSEEEFKYLLKMSPLHNVRVPEDDNVQYPAVLLITADHDDRVVPLHSLKFIAELQNKLGNIPKQTNPIMIRVDTKSGHGSGKPTTKVIEELTDIYSFICKSLDLKYRN